MSHDPELEAIIAHDAQVGLPGWTPVDAPADPFSLMLQRHSVISAKRYTETALLVGTNRFVTLLDDPSGRWRKGETGFMVENDYPEKYDLMLMLPSGSYYFYDNEVRYLGLTDEAQVAKVQAILDASPADAQD